MLSNDKKLPFADRFATSVKVPILPSNPYPSSYATVITTCLNSNSNYLFYKTTSFSDRFTGEI